jgi:hypothetical protein
VPKISYFHPGLLGSRNANGRILREQPSGRIVAVWAKRPEYPLANPDSE